MYVLVYIINFIYAKMYENIKRPASNNDYISFYTATMFHVSKASDEKVVPTLIQCLRFRSRFGFGNISHKLGFGVARNTAICQNKLREEVKGKFSEMGQNCGILPAI